MIFIDTAFKKGDNELTAVKTEALKISLDEGLILETAQKHGVEKANAAIDAAFAKFALQLKEKLARTINA